ncbi:MAG: NHL repeat-containing protein, partial [Nitrospinaceae bacterium]
GKTTLLKLVNRMLMTLGINEMQNLARLTLGAALLHGSAAGPADPDWPAFLERLRDFRAEVHAGEDPLAQALKTSGREKSILDARHTEFLQNPDLETGSQTRDLSRQRAATDFQFMQSKALVNRNSRLRSLLDKLTACLGMTEPPASGAAPLTFSHFIGSVGWPPNGFLTPFGLAHDPDGDLWVTDLQKHAVLRFSPDGLFKNSIGGIGNGPGRFNMPCGLAVGPDGSLFVSDHQNRRIQKFGPGGSFLHSIGDAADDRQALGPLYDVAVDGQGRIWAPDTENHRIQVYDGAGTWIRSLGGAAEKAGALHHPLAICCLEDGGYVVGDRSAHPVKRFDAEGRLMAALHRETGPADEPYAIAWDPRHGLFVADLYHMQILCLSLEMEIRWVWRRRGRRAGEQLQVGGLSLYDGRLFTSDFDNHRVQVMRLGPPAPA